jgi:hypothetical protein
MVRRIYKITFQIRRFIIIYITLILLLLKITVKLN